MHEHRCGGCVWYEAQSGGRSEAVRIGRVRRLETVKIGCVLVVPVEEPEVSILQIGRKKMIGTRKFERTRARLRM